MFTLGIAGQIASGKSTVTAQFVRLGAELVAGDEIGREVVGASATVQEQLVSTFGSGILGPDGEIDRALLAEETFASRKSLERLNKIVHPPLLKELRRRINLAKRSASSTLLIVDAALIFEWGLEAELDATVFVDAPRQRQMKWIAAKGLSREDALRRIRLQMPKYRQRALADYVIQNRGTAAELRLKARALHSKLIARLDR